jgi:A/G-specific adenine glycosylase
VAPEPTIDEIEEFKAAVWQNYRERGRRFPWRETTDPWAILLSEVMLQQTQTERVIPYWHRWVSLWPDPQARASAPFDRVLREWSGLGYNRRARYLVQTASLLVQNYQGHLPSDSGELEKLPGIGPYTARAIACFAFAIPSVFIETNIRSAFLHFFFPDQDGVGDRELIPLVERTLDRDRVRPWYWALMDYGAELKKISPNPNRRSAHYQRQSPFEGSLRQSRGAALKILSHEGSQDLGTLVRLTGIPEDRLALALSKLQDEGLVAEEGGYYGIPGGNGPKKTDDP